MSLGTHRAQCGKVPTLIDAVKRNITLDLPIKKRDIRLAKWNVIRTHYKTSTLAQKARSTRTGGKGIRD